MAQQRKKVTAPKAPVTLSVYVPPDLRRRLRMLAAREGVSASSIVVAAVDARLRKAGL